MCEYGTYTVISVVNRQPNQYPKVDACIAGELQRLNDQGVITLGCCCGHGRAGEIVEWKNSHGTWKGIVQPPHVLISEASKLKAEALGYCPFPYYYADGQTKGTMQMFLKTGCITREDCIAWHKRKRRAEALQVN